MGASAGYSPERYAMLLREAKDAGYAFRSFAEPEVPEGSLFLRHDIDYSLSWAVELAGINEREDARGTFFLQLRSPLYNLLSFENLEAVRELVARGQWIAFHVTLPEEGFAADDLQGLIERDYAVLREAVPETQAVIAWHNPSLHVQEEGLGLEVPGFVNAYGRIAGAELPYVSDSNLRYTVEELVAILHRGDPRLQLALAPMQWMPDHPEMVGLLARNLVRKLRDAEVEFLRNHVYREHFPEGLPETVVQDLERAVCERTRG